VVATGTEELLPLPEAAERLGVSVYTVRRWIKDGKLKAFKPGKEYRVREGDLEEFLAAREVRPKAPTSPSQRSLFNGLEEARREDTEYIHFDIALDRIGDAGNAAQEIVAEWRNESTRMLNEGRPPAKHRTLEMRSFHNELKVIYMSNIADILKAAKQGSISVGYSSDDPQDLAADPSLWPRALRKYIHDAGSRIAVLPSVIEDLEREWAERGFESASLAAQRGDAIEGRLPDEITRDAGWQDAIERAREEAGIR
jgi:excisionase family DNA binding protein